MKKLLISLLCIFIFAPSQAQNIPNTTKYSAEWIKEHYTKQEVMIPMRDGVKLYTAIYEPVDKTKKHPILMQRTCYSAGPYGEGRYAGLHSVSYEPYVDAGYIFVFQDVRGKNMSEGDFDDIRPFIDNKVKSKKAKKNIGQTDEASDTYDTVEWLVNNTNNNGCVGQKGVSYPGFYTTMAALAGHPALKAVSPQAPVTDWFHGDDVHHNGAFMMAEMVSFQPFFEYMMDNDNVRNGVDRSSFKFPSLFHTDFYSDYLRIGTYKNITEAYGDSIAYLRTVREHPYWDEYWESHTVTKGNHMKNVMPAVMVVGGLFDKEDCYGAFDTYKTIKEQSPSTDLYLVEGPWYHGAWTRGMREFWNNVYFGELGTSEYYMANIEYPFFAYYLEGKGEKPKTGALMFDTGKRTWTQYDEGWPLIKRTESTPFYLHADGKVSMERPSKSGIVSYVSDIDNPVPYHMGIETSTSRNYMIDDQRFASQRPDVICFESEALAKDMQLSGEIEVELNVDISSTDADFIVKVIDVYPDDFNWYDEIGINRTDRLSAEIPRYPMGGYQLMVRGEVMRGKFRESFSEPKPFEPGKRTKVKFTMPDVNHTFKPGHKVMIQIQSTWFPLVDRNPQTFCDIYTCDESAYVDETINIHCDTDAPSYVKLPVVK